MSPVRGLPEGYLRRESTRTIWVCEASADPVLSAAGLTMPSGWTARLEAAPDGSSGRGAHVRMALPDGRAVVLKALRRGGLLGPLWRDRHVGTGRLLRNVVLPDELRRRGVSTPEVLALLVEAGPPGLHRGWLAVEALDGVDLRAMLARDGGLSDETLGVALRTVRAAHDAGLRHPDMNLGNLYLARDGVCHILDLDGATLSDRPVGAVRRCRELLRLERSWIRWSGTNDDGSADPGTRILEAYTDGRPRLRRDLALLRPAGRMLLRLRGAGRGGRE